MDTIKGKFITKVNIDQRLNQIKIWNNGKGIPIEIH